MTQQSDELAIVTTDTPIEGQLPIAGLLQIIGSSISFLLWNRVGSGFCSAWSGRNSQAMVAFLAARTGCGLELGRSPIASILYIPCIASLTGWHNLWVLGFAGFGGGEFGCLVGGFGSAVTAPPVTGEEFAGAGVGAVDGLAGAVDAVDGVVEFGESLAALGGDGGAVEVVFFLGLVGGNEVGQELLALGQDCVGVTGVGEGVGVGAGQLEKGGHQGNELGFAAANLGEAAAGEGVGGEGLGFGDDLEAQAQLPHPLQAFFEFGVFGGGELLEFGALLLETGDGNGGVDVGGDRIEPCGGEAVVCEGVEMLAGEGEFEAGFFEDAIAGYGQGIGGAVGHGGDDGRDNSRVADGEPATAMNFWRSAMGY